MRVRIPLNLHVRVHILEDQFLIAVVKTALLYLRVLLLLLNHRVNTHVAEIILTALTHEDCVEVPQTDRAVVLEIIPLFSLFWLHITVLHVLKLELSLNLYFSFRRLWLFVLWRLDRIPR